jgi:hypothetical protein
MLSLDKTDQFLPLPPSGIVAARKCRGRRNQMTGSLAVNQVSQLHHSSFIAFHRVPLPHPSFTMNTTCDSIATSTTKGMNFETSLPLSSALVQCLDDWTLRRLHRLSFDATTIRVATDQCSRATKRPKLQKRVRFANTLVSVLPVPSCSAVSTWYTDDDFEEFERSCSHTIHLAQELSNEGETKKGAMNLDPEEHSLFGLENFMSSDIRQARQLRVQCYRRGILARQRVASQLLPSSSSSGSSSNAIISMNDCQNTILE